MKASAIRALLSGRLDCDVQLPPEDLQRLFESIGLRGRVGIKDAAGFLLVHPELPHCRWVNQTRSCSRRETR